MPVSTDCPGRKAANAAAIRMALNQAVLTPNTSLRMTLHSRKTNQVLDAKLVEAFYIKGRGLGRSRKNAPKSGRTFEKQTGVSGGQIFDGVDAKSSSNTARVYLIMPLFTANRSTRGTGTQCEIVHSREWGRAPAISGTRPAHDENVIAADDNFVMRGL